MSDSEYSADSEKISALPIDHNNEMMKQIKLILDEEQICDVVLISNVDGKRIPTSRLILSAASVYFKAMFTGSLKEANEKEVTISDVDGETLQSLVSHCYNGDLNLSEDNAEQILSAAHLMEFISIVDKCVKFLQKQLKPSNCLGIKCIAERFNCKELEVQAENLICTNFHQVTQNEEFLQLSVDQLDNLLQRDELNIQQEEDIFDSFMLWVKYDEDNRKENIPKLLLNIRMPLMDPKFLAKDVKSVCEANGCMKLYIEALEMKCGADACPKIDPQRIKPRYLSGGYLVALAEEFKCLKYCPKMNQWTQLEEMSIYEVGSGIIVWNKKLVIVGGRLNYNPLNTVKYWDVKLKTWKFLSPLDTPRANVGLAVFGESLYVIGGESKNANGTRTECDGNVYRLDSLTDSWQSVAPLPTPLCNLSAAAYDECIYVVGRSIYGYTTSLLRYAPNTNVWTDLGEISKHSISSLFVINNALYGSGERGIQRYNKNTNSWTLHNKNLSRICATCAVNNRLFVYENGYGERLLKEYKISENVLIDLEKHSDYILRNLIFIPSSII